MQAKKDASFFTIFADVGTLQTPNLGSIFTFPYKKTPNSSGTSWNGTLESECLRTTTFKVIFPRQEIGYFPQRPLTHDKHHSIIILT